MFAGLLAPLGTIGKALPAAVEIGPAVAGVGEPVADKFLSAVALDDEGLGAPVPFLDNLAVGHAFSTREPVELNLVVLSLYGALDVREAAIFEAPPATLAAINAASARIYASHVLSLVEANLNTPEDDSAKRIRLMEQMLEPGRLLKTLETLKSEKTLRIPLGPTRDLGIKMTPEDDFGPDGPIWTDYVTKGKRFSFPRRPREDQWGNLNEEAEMNWYTAMDPRELVPGMLDNLREELAKYKKHDPFVEPYRLQLTGPKLVELELLRKECLRYTSRAKRYKTKAALILPVDLTGWKYIQGIPEAEIKEKLTQSGLASFKLVLYFITHVKRGGQWHIGKIPPQMELDVKFKWVLTVEKFRAGLASLYRVGRHEAQHLGQDALRIVKGLREDGGLPSENIREPGTWPSGTPKRQRGRGRKRIEHPRRDVEFYTRIADEVSYFLDTLTKKNPADRPQMIERWIKSREFFRRIKSNPGKWQKAVSEFYKGLRAEGVRVGADRVAARWLRRVGTGRQNSSRSRMAF